MPPTVHRNVTFEVSTERSDGLPTLDQVSVDILPECPPRCRSSIVGRGSAEITAKSRPRCRSSIGRDIGRVLADSVGRYSTDTRVSADSCRQLSADRCRQMSVECRPIVARVLAECRPIAARVSADSRSSVGRDVGRVWAEISAECRLIVSFDTRPTGV